MNIDTLSNVIEQYPDYIVDIKFKYLILLSQLTQTSYLTTELFMANIKKISSMGATFILYSSAPDKSDFRIHATATIILEPKLLREGMSVGHIEDVVVDVQMRHKGLSHILLNRLKEYAKDNNCYKVILDCDVRLKKVYLSNGFSEKDIIQLSDYF